MATTLTAAAPPRTAERQRVHYDGVAMSLHWATALLVLTLFLLGQGWGFVQRGSPLRHEMQAIHVSLGLLLIAVLVARISWRASMARRLPPADSGLMQLAAQAAHYTLYALLVAAVCLGVTLRWATHNPLSFFGLFTIPAPYDFTRAQAHMIFSAHSWVALLIVCLASLHACAALLHHFVLRDDVLWRMVPAHRRPDAQESAEPLRDVR